MTARFGTYGGVEVWGGDCLGVMRCLGDGSVDAVVTDPPAGIGFMGKSWDAFGAAPPKRSGYVAHNATTMLANGRGSTIAATARNRDGFVAYLAERMAEALRVTKPGGHALVWALPRTSHWTALALEDAGWIIQDRLAHLFGQGFPKHKSKLKPATEDWWLCTKPGGAKWLNVDGCRVATFGADAERHTAEWDREWIERGGEIYGRDKGKRSGANATAGRWPTNLLLTHHPGCRRCGTRRVKGECGFAGWKGGPGNALNGSVDGALNVGPEANPLVDSDGMETVEAWECVDGCPVAEIDRQSGESRSNPAKRNRSPRIDTTQYRNGGARYNDTAEYADSGGASRFFPTFAWEAEDFAPFLYRAKASRSDRGEGNAHPTVKPVALMRWLVRLVTREDDLVLDPFFGSGTTGVACLREGRRCVGVEGEPDYLPLIDARLRAEAVVRRQPTFFDMEAPA